MFVQLQNDETSEKRINNQQKIFGQSQWPISIAVAIAIVVVVIAIIISLFHACRHGEHVGHSGHGGRGIVARILVAIRDRRTTEVSHDQEVGGNGGNRLEKEVRRKQESKELHELRCKEEKDGRTSKKI